MTKGKCLLFNTLAVFFACAAAMPVYAIMSVPSGWYLEGNFGSTNLNNKSYPGSANTSGIGGNANLGYKLMPFLAGEIGYTRYANTTIKGTAGNTAGTDIHYSYDLAARGILPVADTGVELFAKAGIERVNSHVSLENGDAASSIGLSSSQHSATGLYVGAGVQYSLMPEWALNVQWQQARGNSSTGTLNLFSGGVSFILD
jgi:opacity protein-like surface antigen